ncbi:hypothetical protein H6G00_34170 [Leptolyngbya sp. FACHB-541]|uniref:hypothetical protein n=1 Tax=Leptolyngbya sp. FACHB-541 TaxID=2692810 RepID=UPI001688E9CF|nr:hypothetical protein [Leptolyngbya sp. FACHB-541]MBD2001577.1 hypothetical protein [Leptolyngbya sp. FACHB-541]
MIDDFCLEANLEECNFSQIQLALQRDGSEAIADRSGAARKGPTAVQKDLAAMRKSSAAVRNDFGTFLSAARTVVYVFGAIAGSL